MLLSLQKEKHWGGQQYCYVNKYQTRLESYNDPRPSTNQSTSLKSGWILWSVCFVLYVRMYGQTDTFTRNNESLVLWSVLGVDPLETKCNWSTRPIKVTAVSDNYFHTRCSYVLAFRNQGKNTVSRNCGMA